MDDSKRPTELAEQLAKAESELNIFFSLSNDLSCIAGHNGFFQKVNSAWEGVLGWTCDELTSRPWVEFVHPEDVEPTLAAISQCTSDHIAHCENRYRHKNGGYRWLSWRALHHCNGFSYAVGRDITQYKEIEQELQRLTTQLEQQAKTFNRIFSASLAPVYLLSSPERYVCASPAGAKILGLQPNDIVGKTWQELNLSAEFMEPLCAQHAKVFSTGHPYKGESAFPTVDGLKYYEYILTPIYDDDGQVEVIVSTFRDISEYKLTANALQKANEELEQRVIQRTVELQEANAQFRGEITERQKAEVALRESEERFRRIFDEAPIGIALTKGADFQLFMGNQALCQILGYAKEDLDHLSLLNITHSEDQKKEAFYVEQLVADQIDTYQLEKRYIKKNQQSCWVKLTTTVMRAPNREILYGLSMVEDITERKQAEAEIHNALLRERELNDLRSRFITTVSHEFRTPLSIILLSARLLEHFGHQATEEKKRQYLDRIQAAAQNMTRLLDDVLFIGKADAGKLQFNPAPLDLGKFCHELVEEMELAEATQHTVLYSFEGTCQDAEMDEKLLRQILSNLLSNAVKYSAADSQIEFRVVCDPEQVTFRIQDRGIGIPLTAQQQLFESFHRAENVGTIPGTGLGLSIVKKCVDIHGGQITVNSEEGVGTTFTVRLALRSQSEYPLKTSH